MKTYYALIARGETFITPDGSRFNGWNDFKQTDAENLVQAFLQIYGELREETSDISGLKPHGERFMLGFTEHEWDEVSAADIRIKEGYPDREGIQIQAIRDVPFR
jgi:hypothetical protein